jgi:beta-lactamase regulating signal transducer with metallopeptidase domain
VTPVEAWLGYLVSAGVRGGALLALAALVALALRRRSASARHLVWAAGLAGLAVVTLAAGLLPAWHVGALPARPLVLLALLGGPGGATVGEAVTAITGPAGAATLPALPSISSAAAAGDSGWLPVAVLVLWATVSAWLLLRLLLGVLGVARVVRSAVAVEDQVLRALIAQVAARAGRDDFALRVRLSDQIDAPVTAGVCRPVVLLPVAAPSWPAERLRTVLAHELGHVQRCDCLFQLLAQVVAAVHWWNPLCWLAEHRMRIERELACDDYVLADGTRPSAYADLLLELRQVVQVPRRNPLFDGAFMLGCAPLATRVERLLDAHRSHRLPGRRLVGAVLGVALLLALPAACLTGDPRGEPNLLVYRTAPGAQAATAAVLGRRLQEMGLRGARVIPQGTDRLMVELPNNTKAASLGSVRAALERKGALTLTVVAEEHPFSRTLAEHVARDPEARGRGVLAVNEHWRGGPDGTLDLVDAYLRGPRAELPRYLASLPPELQPPAGHALLLDHIEVDQLRTVLVDRRQGMVVEQVADGRVSEAVPHSPTNFEVDLTLAPQDAARLKALTAANVGKHMALELDEGELWGAPVIRSAMGARVKVTAAGALAEAERLAAGFRAGTLPAPMQLLFSGGDSSAVGLGPVTAPSR